MATKKSSFINAELEWAEQQLVTWKAYVDTNPLHELRDRMSFKETKNGGMIPMVVASIEQQGKFIQDTMKNYLQLLAEVDKMRTIEDAKKTEARGGQDVSLFESGEI